MPVNWSTCCKKFKIKKIFYYTIRFMIMKNAEKKSENPFLAKPAFNLDYQSKFMISLVNNDILNYVEKRKGKKSFFNEWIKTIYS